MKIFCLVLFTFIISLKLFSSGWEPLHYGMNLHVQTIYIDSANNKIYAGGQFTEADSVRVNNIAVWDGVKWDSVGTGARYGLYNNAITSFQGSIYSDGYYSPSGHNRGGKLTNAIWDTLGFGLNALIFQIKEINGELWFGGQFSQAGGDSCTMLAKYDGTNWSCMDLPYQLGGRVEDFIMYNDTLVCGGLFRDTNHVGISYFDGSQFQILGHRLYGGIAGVSSMVIYRGDLYIAGYFLASAGNEGNHIMRWDGANWFDVGGGMDDEVYILKVYNEELYAGGVFQHAGGIHTGNLAKWNGISWAKVTPSIISTAVSDIQFYNDEIYIGGAFRYIDSIPVNYIAKYRLNTEINENNIKENLKIFPNPSSGLITIEMKHDKIYTLKVINILGREVRAMKIDSPRCELDISEVSAGIYFFQVETNNGIVIKKIVKY